MRVDPELRAITWPNGFDLEPDVLHGDHEAVAAPAAPDRGETHPHHAA